METYFYFSGKKTSFDIIRCACHDIRTKINKSKRRQPAITKKNSKYIKRCPLLSTMTLKNCKAFQNQEKEKNKTPELTSEKKRKRFVRCHVFEQPTFEIVNWCTEKGVDHVHRKISNAILRWVQSQWLRNIVLSRKWKIAAFLKYFHYVQFTCELPVMLWTLTNSNSNAKHGKNSAMNDELYTM